MPPELVSGVVGKGLSGSDDGLSVALVPPMRSRVARA